MPINLERNLQTVGKGTFVKYYEYFNNPKYVPQEIKTVMRKSENYAESSIGTKVSTGLRIIRERNGLRALQIIINSQRVEPQARKRAQELLTQYRN